jgi:hypothetical protein
MNPHYRTTNTPAPITSHHRRRRQGPLHNNWQSCHRRRCLPTPSSSATAAIVDIVAITGLVVAWCGRLPPPSSSSLSSTADATPPTMASPPPCLVLLPPLRSPPRRRRALSALSIAHGAVIDRHVAPMRPPSRSDTASAAPTRAPLIGIRTHCVSAAVTLRRPAVYPPSLLRPPPPVGRRRRKHGNVDGRPWQPGAAKTTP